MPEPSAREWVMLRTATDQLTAEIWRGLLEAENIAAMLAPGDAISFLGVSTKPCRLMVSRDQVETAGAVLSSQLAAESLSPNRGQSLGPEAAERLD